jgi:hypothetical protein
MRHALPAPIVLLRPLLFLLALLIPGALGATLRADVEPARPGGDVDRDRPGGKKDEDAPAPKPEVGKPGEDGNKADDPEAIHQKLEAEARENLKEINRLMDKVRNDLAQKQTGEPTQAQQRDVVRKIQELIDKIQNAPRSSSQSDSDNPNEKPQKGQKGQKKQSSQRQENEKQGLRPDQKDGKDKKPGSPKDQDPKGSGKVENDRKMAGKLPPSAAGTLKDKAEQLERWGVLPKKVVEQMMSGNRKGYPPEYEEIISKYYERLSKLYEETRSGE